MRKGTAHEGFRNSYSTPPLAREHLERKQSKSSAQDTEYPQETERSRSLHPRGLSQNLRSQDQNQIPLRLVSREPQRNKKFSPLAPLLTRLYNRKPQEKETSDEDLIRLNENRDKDTSSFYIPSPEILFLKGYQQPSSSTDDEKTIKQMGLSIDWSYRAEQIHAKIQWIMSRTDEPMKQHETEGPMKRDFRFEGTIPGGYKFTFWHADSMVSVRFRMVLIKRRLAEGLGPWFLDLQCTSDQTNFFDTIMGDFFHAWWMIKNYNCVR